MELIKNTQRGVLEKQTVQYHSVSAGHQSGIVIPPDNWAQHDPFLVMGKEYIHINAFEAHPHRGMETVTYMIDGKLQHRDSFGGAGELVKGDVQWMTAGSGIIHEERPVLNGYAHFLQLWVNLPAKDKMVPPSYQDISAQDAPTYQQSGVVVKVISGSAHGVIAPTRNHTAVTMLEIQVEKGIHFPLELPGEQNGFIFILEGSGRFGSEKTPGERDDLLWLTRSETSQSTVSVFATDHLKILAVTGKPLGENVVFRGPFVMNTKEEVDTAFEDFHKGRFGRLTKN